MNRKWKKAVTAGVLLTALAGVSLFSVASAAEVEKEMYLGVVNGQVKGNQWVEVTRTLPSPELYRETESAKLPEELRIRHASARSGDNGSLWLTVTQDLPGGERASVTVKAALWVDGSKTVVSYREEGLDVVVSVPAALRQVVLRSDTPVTLTVPAGWRGPVRIIMDIEGGRRAGNT